jgi:hypothetical protein
VWDIVEGDTHARKLATVSSWTLSGAMTTHKSDLACFGEETNMAMCVALQHYFVSPTHTLVLWVMWF